MDEVPDIPLLPRAFHGLPHRLPRPVRIQRARVMREGVASLGTAALLLAIAACTIAGDQGRALSPPVTQVALAPRSTAVPSTATIASTSTASVPSPTRAAMTTTALPTRTADAPATASSARYSVQSGDTLFSLARRFGTSVADLATLNRLPSDGSGLRAGQELQLPSGIWSSGLNVRVTRPEPGATLRSPIVVEGSASTFEAVVQVELLGGDGTVLAHVTTRANPPDVGRHGPFQATLQPATAASTRPVTVRVYWSSPRDGSPTDEVRIPITIGAAA
jgi:LysM repeat protein